MLFDELVRPVILRKWTGNGTIKPFYKGKQMSLFAAKMSICYEMVCFSDKKMCKKSLKSLVGLFLMCGEMQAIERIVWVHDVTHLIHVNCSLFP